MDNPLQKIVAQRMKELGLKPIPTATSVGLERGFIRDILRGKKRTLKMDKIEPLARALKMDPDDLGLGVLGGMQLRRVRVSGWVQAGLWDESSEFPDDEQYDVHVPKDDSLANFQLYGAEVRGPSMNRRYNEGTVLIFTRIDETGEDFQVGRRYIVERERADGLREMTVKKLWQDGDGTFWLLPESDDPRFQESIPLSGDEHDTIRIVGRVRYHVGRD